MTRQPALRSEAGDHGDLAGHHHVGPAADAVDQRLAATVEIVELRLGDRIIDVDGREQELALLGHVVEPMHARGGLFGHALDGFADAAIPAMVGRQALLDRRVENLLLLVGGGLEEGRIAALGPDAEVDQQRGIAAIVQDHVGRAPVGPFEDAVRVVPVVDEALALDGEDWRAGDRDGGRCVVLGRVDVARGPADVGTERLQGLDQHGRLDRHMKRTCDPGSLERLRGTIFRAHRHQAGHLGFGDGDLLAAPAGEGDIGDGGVGVAAVVGHGRRSLSDRDDPGV